MTKTSTLHFTLNNLASKANAELNDVYTYYDLEAEYAEIFEMLEDLSQDVRQGVVDNILHYAVENE